MYIVIRYYNGGYIVVNSSTSVIEYKTKCYRCANSRAIKLNIQYKVA
jgi:hypothetical protein